MRRSDYNSGSGSIRPFYNTAFPALRIFGSHTVEFRHFLADRMGGRTLQIVHACHSRQISPECFGFVANKSNKFIDVFFYHNLRLYIFIHKNNG